MATNSHIEWTDATWNPVTGCTKISPGCKHCYAERIANRLQAMGQANYRNGFEVTLQPQMLELPLEMEVAEADLRQFHERLVSCGGSALVYQAKCSTSCARAHWHQYQVLTKRSERLEELSPKLRWEPQIWMGVSVENEDYAVRIDHLRRTDAHVKFLSLEPLLGPLPQAQSSRHRLGDRRRRIRTACAGRWTRNGSREIRDQCLNAGVPFFFKQWGGVNKEEGRPRTGRPHMGPNARAVGRPLKWWSAIARK